MLGQADAYVNGNDSYVALQTRPKTKVSGEALPPWQGGPKIMSLWDLMFSLRLHNFLHAYTELFKTYGAAGTFATVTQKPDQTATPDALDEVKHFGKRLGRDCAAYGFSAAEERAGHIESGLTKRPTWREILHQVTTFEEALFGDLKGRRFAYIPEDRGKMLNRVEKDWGRIWEAFPSDGITKSHIQDGIEAFALGLHTACVYHMMVVLEPGIQALAAALKVPVGKKDWASLLRGIENALAAQKNAAANMPPGSKPLSRPALRKRDVKHTFYSEAAKEFAHFKDAWRNHTAHGRAVYDEHDAAKVLDHVHSFMQLLVKNGLKEKK
jgi:hypothetical protein